MATIAAVLSAEPAVRASGFYATTASALSALLQSDHILGQPLVADLSLGAWKAHSLARQFAAQLEVSLPAASSSYTPENQFSFSYAEVVAQGIDAEAMGNRSVRTAVHFAQFFEEILRRRRATFVILAPRFQAGWEDEDILLMEFLAREIGDLRLLIVAGGAAAPALPAGWTADWKNQPAMALPLLSKMLGPIPDTPAARLAALLAGGEEAEALHVTLPGGWVVIAPECRRDPREVPLAQFDRLAAALAEHDVDLAAYAQYHGSSFYLDRQALCAQAWSQFSQGGVGIALRYLERAENCAHNPVERAAFTCQKQGMRIARLRFADAAAEPDPRTRLPAEIQSFLLQAKGWGLAQTGKAAAAREVLIQAQELAASPRTGREYLYLLNIRALAEVRSGDSAQALLLEHAIEEQLTGLPVPDWRLTYVNSINQARLYRYVRDWRRSLEYYQKAFATTWGIRSESDAVYTNLCLATLANETGPPEEALLLWVRAALHWAACARPEELTWRIVQALIPGVPLMEALNRKTCEHWVAQVSGALLAKLREAAARCAEPPRLCGQAAAYPIVRIENLADRSALRSQVGGPGWAVLTAEAHIRITNRPEAHDELRQWLCSWIQGSGHAVRGNCYVVDSRRGKEMAATLAESLETCVRLGVRHVWFDGELIELKACEWDALSGALQVRLGPGVASVAAHKAGAVVQFKRYLPPRRIAGEEARVAQLLYAGGSLAVSAAGPPLSFFRSLEDACVVECVLGSEACVAVGIKSHSSAILSRT